MRYTVTVNRVEVATGLPRRQAAALATTIRNDGQVFIRWYRASDGQHGYYNSDGNHDITGKAW